MIRFYRLIYFVLFLTPLCCFARAGGGGGSVGTFGAGTPSNGSRVSGAIIFFIVFSCIAIYLKYTNRQLEAKNKKVQRLLSEISRNNPMWIEEKLLQQAMERFFELQQAWSDQNLEVMQKLLHPLLYPVWLTRINQQLDRNEKNIVSEISIRHIQIVNVLTRKNSGYDSFTVSIDARAKDQLLKKNGKLTPSRKKSFIEFWTFRRYEENWLLLEVTQAKYWKKFIV